MQEDNGKINWKHRVILAVLAGLIFIATLYVISTLAGGERPDMYQLFLEGLIFTIVYGIGIFYFTDFIPRLKRNIVPDLLQGEEIEKEGSANLRRGIGWVGGKVFLTGRRLVFKSHTLNIRKGQTNIAREEIENIYKKKTFLFLKNQMKIVTKEGKKFNFIVKNRDAWIESLKEKQ